MSFWWCLSPDFLILNPGNLLITDCWGIDLKFQPLEKLFHPQDSWETEEEEEEGVIQSV